MDVHVTLPITKNTNSVEEGNCDEFTWQSTKMIQTLLSPNGKSTYSSKFRTSCRVPGFSVTCFLCTTSHHTPLKIRQPWFGSRLNFMQRNCSFKAPQHSAGLHGPWSELLFLWTHAEYTTNHSTPMCSMTKMLSNYKLYPFITVISPAAFVLKSIIPPPCVTVNTVQSLQ